MTIILREIYEVNPEKSTDVAEKECIYIYIYAYSENVYINKNKTRNVKEGKKM